MLWRHAIKRWAATFVRWANLIRRFTSRCSCGWTFRQSEYWRSAISLHTDIAGAAGAELAACWVLDGIHGGTLADGSGGFDRAKVEAAATAAGLSPSATLPRLVW